ncbi:2,4-dihydroxyhept-2-ene-1,7-dioic acid aldolase [Amylibacter ulvae]|uniref:2,4-dihydroxyhept-2-ene-1,7-dioic acid aldolase n=1 Tax=Paramylibacter ulvae TaxID=1651968 RepID=A0ABQ3D5W5_9RHOB|nr:aldolase/citrate lyase family protein [Amylibacter ulvae]GHA58389.1 2,4-dihydroxyhept-2-ene-1,7-dioic acid aldolase [Amylibacter ulvae]
MPAPVNQFKKRLNTDTQIGLWLGLTSPLVAEICARRGFDWLVIDGEHSPNDLQSMQSQLNAIAQTDASSVVRIPIGETWLVKQVLDLGAQTILIPMIETAEHAQEMAKAVQYPPNGTRGVGASLARASQFNAIADYVSTADAEICLLLQVESRVALQNLDEILNIDNVHGIFIGPADLAADMGYPGKPETPAVQDAINEAIAKIISSDKAAGILTSDQNLAQGYIDAGAKFVAVGSDVGLLSLGAKNLRALY